MSALVNCTAVNCSSPTEANQRTCYLLSALQSGGLGSPCPFDNTTSGQLVRTYWGSDELCGIGVRPVVFPGLMTELMCCDSDGCNSPGAALSPLQCLTAASAITGGYCAGRTFVYRMCSSQQEEVDTVAAHVNTVTSPPPPNPVCI